MFGAAGVCRCATTPLYAGRNCRYRPGRKGTGDAQKYSAARLLPATASGAARRSGFWLLARRRARPVGDSTLTVQTRTERDRRRCQKSKDARLAAPDNYMPQGMPPCERYVSSSAMVSNSSNRPPPFMGWPKSASRWCSSPRLPTASGRVEARVSARRQARK